MKKGNGGVIQESRMFASAIISTMLGAVVVIAFGIWRYFIIADHDAFIRFFEYIVLFSIIGVWLAAIVAGLKGAVFFLKKQRNKYAFICCTLVLLANGCMALGSVGVVFNHYAAQLTFKSDAELIALLQDPVHKWAASYKIGNRRVHEAVPALCIILEDSNEEINLRHNAAIALGRICAPPHPNDATVDAALASLTRILEGSDDLLLSTVANALGEIKDERALIPLGNVVQNESRSSYTRMEAARAIGKIGGTKALAILVSIHESSNDIGFKESLELVIHSLQKQATSSS